MKVEVDVLGSPSLIVRTVSVDVNQHYTCTFYRVQELRESRGGRPGLPVPNSPHGFCGREATLNDAGTLTELRSCVKVEVAVLGFPYGLCGREAVLNEQTSLRAVLTDTHVPGSKTVPWPRKDHVRMDRIFPFLWLPRS